MFSNRLISPLYTDLYQLTMAQSYFLNGKHEDPASFDYFFRKIPFKGGYVVFAGLQELLQLMESLSFEPSELDYLKQLGFKDPFLAYLSSFQFKGAVEGMNEGEIVFPFEPLLRVSGGLLEVQLIETLLLNMLNFQSLIATKASRIRFAAGKRMLSDFGLRRAQGFGGIHASRAAFIGGFDSTSNVYAGKRYDIPVAGTMAHSYIESFDSELEAFRSYAEAFPDNCTLLVDTYNTLTSGIPNAIIVAKEMAGKGHSLKAVRLDSGDLAYLAKRARSVLDESGLPDVKIVVSNQLDEQVVKSLIEQHAPIDIFGVGTSMIIGKPDAAIDGVFKLGSFAGKARLKISENVKKTTLPGEKKVWRMLDEKQHFFADCISLKEEPLPVKMIHPFQKEKTLSFQAAVRGEDLFVCHMRNGKSMNKAVALPLIRERVEKRLSQLPGEHKRFDFPHIYKVGISEKLAGLRQELIEKYQQFV